MLPKSQRLHTEDFKDLRKARTVHAQHLFIRVAALSGNGTSSPAGRSAVIVAASTYKKAVDRNLLRRRMYHVIAKHPDVLRGESFTVTLKKGALECTSGELEREFLQALSAKGAA